MSEPTTVNASVRLSVCFAIVCIYVFLHIGAFSLDELATDDYLQRAYALGSTPLSAVGLLGTLQTSTADFFIHNQFNFFDPATGNLEAMRQYGALPWWTESSSHLHLWRPLTSLTHWLDYQLFPDSIFFMHLHNSLWLLLGFVGVLFLYRHFLPASVFFIAVAIYVVDISLAPVVGWVAARNSLLVLSFLPLCLYGVVRSEHSKAHYFLALASYILALLSAEAGIIVFMYVFSYYLLLSRQHYRLRVWHLLPFVIVTLVWRYSYHIQGYGSSGISQYIDPATHLPEFLRHVVGQFPLLFLEMLTGIDALEVLVSDKVLTVLKWLGWILAVIFALVTWRLRAQFSQIVFWYSAALLSLLPGVVMYSTDPRILIYSQVGFSVWAACVIVACWRGFGSSTAINRVGFLFMGSMLVFLHLIVQLLATLAMNYLVMATDVLNPEKEFDLVYGFKEQISASDHVVLLNHPDVFRLMYYPYIADYHGFVLPRSLRSMGYAQNDLRVKRLAQFTYELAPEGGFLLHPKDLPVSSTTKPHSLRYAVFFDDGVYSFSENDQIQFPEMTIHIRQVSEMHRPLVVNVELSQEKSPVLLYWDSLTKQHKRLPSLLVGETFFIPAAQ